MKLLESGRLEALSSMVSNLEIGEWRIVGRIESYSCKVRLVIVTFSNFIWEYDCCVDVCGYLGSFVYLTVTCEILSVYSVLFFCFIWLLLFCCQF